MEIYDFDPFLYGYLRAWSFSIWIRMVFESSHFSETTLCSSKPFSTSIEQILIDASSLIHVHYFFGINLRIDVLLDEINNTITYNGT